MHPSFGPVPEAEFRKAESAPAMVTTDILRRFAPLFGLDKGSDGDDKTFAISFTRNVSITETTTIEITASSEEQARAIALSMDVDAFDWQRVYGSKTVDDAEINNIKVAA